MILPGVAQADILRTDAQHMHMLDLRQAAGPVDPGAAVDTERVAHVIRVVVADDQLEFLLRRQAIQQQLAEVVIVTAAGKYTAVIAGHLCVQGGFQLFELCPAAAETDFFLPGLQRQRNCAGNVTDGTVEIENQRRSGLAHAVCSWCHWVSLSK